MAQRTLFFIHSHIDVNKKPQHVAFAEINALANIIRNNLRRSVEHISFDRYRDFDVTALPFDLVVFGPGEPVAEVKELAARATELFYVLPDQSWDAAVDFGRQYTLITQLQTLDGSDWRDELNELLSARPGLCLNPSDITQHHYFPMAEMPFHDHSYMEMFQSGSSRETQLLVDSMKRRVARSGCPAAYAGSLKKDRAELMANYAALGLCDLYGRYLPDDVLSHWTSGMGTDRNIRSAIRGWLSPFDAWRAYEAYSSAILFSEREMTRFNSDRLRLFEYALAGATVKVVSSDHKLYKQDVAMLETCLLDDTTGRASLDKYHDSLEMSLVDRLRDVFGK